MIFSFRSVTSFTLSPLCFSFRLRKATRYCNGAHLEIYSEYRITEKEKNAHTLSTKHRLQRILCSLANVSSSCLDVVVIVLPSSFTLSTKAKKTRTL